MLFAPQNIFNLAIAGEGRINACPEPQYSQVKTIYAVDGTGLALSHIGLPIPNGSMLGALAATGLVDIESIKKAIEYFFGKKAGEKNGKAARAAYENVKKA